MDAQDGGLPDGVLVGVCRQDDDREAACRGDFRGWGERLDAVHLGHLQVEDRRVEVRSALQHGQGLSAIGRLPDLALEVVREHAPDDSPGSGVVIDDQDAHGRLASAWLSPRS